MKLALGVIQIIAVASVILHLIALQRTGDPDHKNGAVIFAVIASVCYLANFIVYGPPKKPQI